MLYWQLRNGKWISDNQMTKHRLNTADMYGGLVKGPVPIKVNTLLAKRIREMSNSEYNRHFGVANKKKEEK